MLCAIPVLDGTHTHSPTPQAAWCLHRGNVQRKEGIPFAALLRRCQEEMKVATERALRHILEEFEVQTACHR